MVKSPDKSDPDGTNSMSKKELKERQETIARNFIGMPPAKTDNPEGVPKGEGEGGEGNQ